MAAERESTDAGAAVEAAIEDDAAQAKQGRYGWLSTIVAGLFALIYAYSVWQAIGNLVALPAFYDQAHLGSENVPWWLLWVGVLIPIAIFALAFVVGRKRNVLGKALIFVVGLAVTAGLSLGVIALESVLRPVLVIVQQSL
jgi:hypothetical protein